MTRAAASFSSRVGAASCSLGVVSFLNARPLVDGLDEDSSVGLVPAVPARLAGMLRAGEVDVALLPVVDLWHGGDGLRIVSDACIGSQAETLTVRIFSRIPPDRITRLAVDRDSHTSVLLARLLWAELYQRDLECVPVPAQPGGTNEAEAVLLIGDKVVTSPPRGHGFEVDLGGAWKHLTGLPFVFAVWAGASDRDWSDVGRTLSSARDRGVARAGQIAEELAPRHGWPIPLAQRYLRETLCYTLTDAMRAGMGRFRAMIAAREPLCDQAHQP